MSCFLPIVNYCNLIIRIRRETIFSILVLFGIGGPVLHGQGLKQDEEKQFAEFDIVANKIGNACFFGILKATEHATPHTCAFLLKYLSSYDSSYLEPFLPGAMPFLKSD